MKSTTRLCAFLLTLLMLLPACQTTPPAETKESTDATQPPVTEETEATEPAETRPLPDIPDTGFDGEEFRVLYRLSTYAYSCEDVIADDGITGDLINDTVYNRNVKLEDALGIHLTGIPQEQPIAYVRKDFTSGSQGYDVVLEQMNAMATDTLNKRFGDWNAAPYFDPDKPWWDKNCAEELSVHHKLYLMASDVSMMTSNGARFLFYNKELLENNNLGNPYELVEDGKWTIDVFQKMISTVSEDLNGDGKMDGQDRYGLLRENTTFFISGCGVYFTSKNENDEPVVDCINERTLRVLEAIREIFTDNEHTCHFDTVAKGQDTSAFAHIFDYGRSRFAAGQFLFSQNGAVCAYQFADMEDRYGVLPNPKLDEAQTQYYHLVDPFSPIWAFAADGKNPALTSAAMEMWGYLSADLVEAFYETTLKKRRFDAQDDAAMLDIIRSSIRYEISDIYDMGLVGIFNNSYMNGDLLSNYQRSKNVIDRKITRIISKIED